jgi:hypothetical protein
MAYLMKNEKKTAFLPTTIINMFERSCGTLKEGKEKTRCH